MIVLENLTNSALLVSGMVIGMLLSKFILKTWGNRGALIALAVAILVIVALAAATPTQNFCL